MHCTNCGKQMPEGAEFCTSCGHQVPQTEPAQPVTAPAAPVAEAPPKKSGGATCWIIGCIVFFIVAVVGGLGIYFGGRYVAKKLHKPNIEVERPQQETELETSEGHSGETGDDDPEQHVASQDRDKARQVVEDFFAAWSEGDVEAMRALAADNVDPAITEDVIGSYEVVSLEIEFRGRRAGTDYEFSVVEVITQENTIAEETTNYSVTIAFEEGEWLLVDLEKMRSEMSGEEGREEAEKTLYAFFDAWEIGDLDGWIDLMTDAAGRKVTQEDVGYGYEQIGFEIVYVKHPDKGAWAFQVIEDYANPDGDEGQESYEIWVVLEDGEWLVDDIYIFEEDEEDTEDE